MTLQEAIERTLADLNDDSEQTLRDKVEARIAAIIDAQENIKRLEEIIDTTRRSLATLTEETFTRESLKI